MQLTANISTGTMPQLMPTMLDNRAEVNPNRLWARFPVSPTSYADGFQAATYGQMRAAVDRVSWLLVEQIGTNTQFETLAYLGPGDLRYHIVLLAAIKTGYKMFFPSPRNSIVAQKELLTRTGCNILLTTDPEPPMVPSLLREYPLQMIRIPSLQVLLSSDEPPMPYPYDKIFEEVCNDPILVLHTSGSTGIPKPIVYTHNFIRCIVMAVTQPVPEGLERIDDLFLRGEFFSFLPAFHIAGIGWGLVLPLFSDSIPVLPLPSRPPSTDGFMEAMRHGRFDWAFVVPMIIEELTEDGAALSLIATKLQYLFYTGGALPHAAGERAVAAGIKIFSGLGSSECSALPQVRSTDESAQPASETWRYVRFHPAAQAEFRHRMDDLYELVVRRSAEDTSAQPVFALFPHLNEYETRDLFSPHPHLPDLWTHRGRRDDLIVLLNGEKANPVSSEAKIAAHSAVRAALIAGNQRVEVCLLVEPTPEALLGEGNLELAKRGFIDDIWPTIEATNRECPAHARISRSKILVLNPDMHMLRAGKGTVQREATLRLYAPQIEALYADSVLTPPLSPVLSEKDISSVLCKLVVDITEWSEVQEHADFFAQGMDSLQLLRLSATIRSRLGISIPPAVIYRNPSITSLVKQIYHNKIPVVEKDRKDTLQQMLQYCKQRVDQIASEPTEASSGNHLPQQNTVILTGSTGMIGSFLLSQLLADPKIAHIFCFNRSVDSGSLQLSRNQQRGVSCVLDPDRVTFLAVDLTKPALGLDDLTFQAVLEQTTRIIHCAWPVNFNQPVSFFQSSLDGLLNLISVAYHGKQNPTLLFLSSVSAVGSCDGLVPEAVLSDLASPAPMGYGESKYLAERLIDYAASILPALRLGIARIGQVSGTARGPNGAWARTEWLPSLIVSSRYLNALPASLGGSRMDLIDWVPVDDLAIILAELSEALTSTSTETGKLSVFHCVNPKRISWSDLVPVIIQESFTTQSPQVTVAFEEWLTRLQNSASAIDLDQGSKDALWHNPAVKLLDFFYQLLANGRDNGVNRGLATDNTLHVSKALVGLQEIQPKRMQKWIREWIGKENEELRN